LSLAPFLVNRAHGSPALAEKYAGERFSRASSAAVEYGTAKQEVLPRRPNTEATERATLDQRRRAWLQLGYAPTSAHILPTLRRNQPHFGVIEAHASKVNFPVIPRSLQVSAVCC
jgi:hypothetical protein